MPEQPTYRAEASSLGVTVIDVEDDEVVFALSSTNGGTNTTDFLNQAEEDLANSGWKLAPGAYWGKLHPMPGSLTQAVDVVRMDGYAYKFCGCEEGEHDGW